eukprot:TRINITY_DN3429_c0_g1_i3.p1 TRINITY_DN3429_c0_g1~~TRINITY_DN3429_c0_g1_i3.p1  ORF type:complete len:59 (-),score=3.88 TRINITY_DN3429_c0_g1_i3:188-364(-)
MRRITPCTNSLANDIIAGLWWAILYSIEDFSHFVLVYKSITASLPSFWFCLCGLDFCE